MIQLGTIVKIVDNSVLYSVNVLKFWIHPKVD